MKLNTKVGALLTTFVGTASVCYADLIGPSVSPTVTRGLADWVSLVAEVLSLLCLVMFIIYTGKFITHSNKVGETTEGDQKFSDGIKNGVMTSLVGIAICQAAIIVAQAVFVK